MLPKLTAFEKRCENDIYRYVVVKDGRERFLYYKENWTSWYDDGWDVFDLRKGGVELDPQGGYPGMRKYVSGKIVKC